MMTQALRYQFELFGVLKGRTKVINGHLFEEGRCDIICDDNSAPYLRRYLSSYGAYARGTPEYAEVKKLEDGSNDTDKGGERDATDEVQGELPKVQQQTEETPSDTGEEPVDTEAGQTGERSDRDGHGHTGVPTLTEFQNRTEPTEPEAVASETIKTAVLKLDPENENHWTSMGLPRVDAVEEAYGKAGVTRGDINAAFPNGWNRDAAIESTLNA
jgi:hypothetical protein